MKNNYVADDIVWWPSKSGCGTKKKANSLCITCTKQIDAPLDVRLQKIMC